MAAILLLQGPNLNLLGMREPKHYGATTLATLHHQLTELAKANGHQLHCVQSNAEHTLIERVHHCREDGTQYIIINPAAFTHTSIALRDALLAIAVPFIEVHLSNIHAREPFRQVSYFSDIAAGVITGLGAFGYTLALQAAMAALTQS